MRQHFSENFRPTEDEKKAIWAEAVFVFDTNVLLNMYRMSRETSSAIMGILKSLKGRLFLPHQVGVEFFRRREEEEVAKQANAFESVRQYLKRIPDLLKEKFSRHPYPRPGRPRHLRAAPARLAQPASLGPRRPQPPARPHAAAPSQRGRRGLGLRRHRLRQAGPLFRRRAAAILRHLGQDRQLPGHRQLSLRRTHPGLAGRHPLYLPKEWACDPARRHRAQVPEDVEFQTKPEIALALLDQARRLGMPPRCRDRRRRLRRQSQLPGGPGVAQASVMWSPCAATSASAACAAVRRRNGPTRWSAAQGKRAWRRCAGGRGARAGCGAGSWPCAAGGCAPTAGGGPVG